MRVLFTGFTSRTIGSDRNVYDYMSNVFVLQRAIEMAGHEVVTRPVSLLEDPCIEEDFDCAVIGIAACQGLSSRFKLGACWALHKFGKRAGIFPSDGKNIYVFPSSVLTCLTDSHHDKVKGKALDPIEYFLGDLQQERNNVLDSEIGHNMMGVWRSVLSCLPHSPTNPRCEWKMIVSTHTWGNPQVYARHFGAQVSTWDPTNIAIPMQFPAGTLAPDGRLPQVHTALNHERRRAWLLTSLQDQNAWLKKQKFSWPVIEIGNKRKARAGAATDYIPELQLVNDWYTKHWGTLAFGYPLAEGGWWRMRYIHGALAGIVTIGDDNDTRRMPEAYRHSRALLERWADDKLQETARLQHEQLMASAMSVDESVARVDAFVKGLVA